MAGTSIAPFGDGTGPGSIRDSSPGTSRHAFPPSRFRCSWRRGSTIRTGPFARSKRSSGNAADRSGASSSIGAATARIANSATGRYQRWPRSSAGSPMGASDKEMTGRTGIHGPNRVPSKALPRTFYDRDTVAVARDLLGKHLIHVSRGVERIGRIVEVEAYLGTNDLASHSSRGMTGRTRVMFGPPGHAYVYLVYGMHCCMNVVTQREGHASAVLLRAIEPVKNVEGSTRGPGRLCKAMHIDRRLNDHDLTSGDLYIAGPPVSEPLSIVRRARVGVDYAGHWAKS